MEIQPAGQCFYRVLVAWRVWNPLVYGKLTLDGERLSGNNWTLFVVSSIPNKGKLILKL